MLENTSSSSININQPTLVHESPPLPSLTLRATKERHFSTSPSPEDDEKKHPKYFSGATSLATTAMLWKSVTSETSGELIKVTRLKHTLFDGKKLVNIETVSNPISLSSFRFPNLTWAGFSRFSYHVSLSPFNPPWFFFEINEFPYIFEGFPSKIGDADLTLKTNVFIISFNVFILLVILWKIWEMALGEKLKSEANRFPRERNKRRWARGQSRRRVSMRFLFGFSRIDHQRIDPVSFCYSRWPRPLVLSVGVVVSSFKPVDFPKNSMGVKIFLRKMIELDSSEYFISQNFVVYPRKVLIKKEIENILNKEHFFF